VNSRKINEEGIGVIEAPRSTLFHHYWVDPGGRMLKANLLVATGTKNLAMNRAVAEAARRYISRGNVSEGMLNRIEVAIRCYDPCLSRSSHALGQMPIELTICGPDRRPIRVLTSQPGNGGRCGADGWIAANGIVSGDRTLA
jgi:NAD-reducing hydrogenase large subunit